MRDAGFVGLGLVSGWLDSGVRVVVGGGQPSALIQVLTVFDITT
jgi:hypothetical protein